MAKSKELLFSVGKHDCSWSFYRGSGAGGQKRNKTENCARCTHILSGAVGKSEEGRSKEQNKKRAFRRMAESETFLEWVRIEAARRTGELDEIERKVDAALQKVKVEMHDERGLWVPYEDRLDGKEES